MDEDKWIAVDKRSNKLIIRFRVSGYRKQFFISTRLKDTKRNREIVRSRRDAIATDISLGRFDATLDSYQFRATAIVPSTIALKPETCEIKQIWERFTDFQETQLEKTTIQGRYKTIQGIVNRLPTQSLTEATTIRDWLLTSFSPLVAHVALASLNQCCEWAIASRLIFDNPFKSLQFKKPKKTSIQAEDFRAFTLEQRDLIIQSFEDHQRYYYYAPLVKFLFWTGCRPGEAFALTWGDINADCTRITINKSYASKARITKGTKNNKRRVFPCPRGSKLQQLLFAMQPVAIESTSLIFRSKNNYPMTSRIFEKFWRGESIGGHYANGVVLDLDKQGKIPYLKPYATRHTFATWAIASGITPDKVAYWLGDDVATILKYYVHPEVSKGECPDF